MTNDRSVVGSETLLRGALYALQQCGLALADAVLLFEADRFATAMGVALLAREEMGRFEILLEMWRNARAGTPVSVADVTSACDDHEEKQRRARMSSVLRGQGDTGVGKLIWAKLKNPPDSEAYRAADSQLKEITERQEARQPHDRHRQRMRAFYVDLVSPSTWALPLETSAKDAANTIVDAVNDYSVTRDRILHGRHLSLDTQLADAVEAIPDKPELPPRTDISHEKFVEVFEGEPGARQNVKAAAQS